jgi:DNA-binding FrmR family transcriptional regulator
MTVHKSHKDVVNRIKRASGHLERVSKMISDEHPCVEIAQQLHAVINALISAKKLLVQDHIENCLTAALESSSKNARDKIEEFKEIAKYL